jgi:hypothetical protein
MGNLQPSPPHESIADISESRDILETDNIRIFFGTAFQEASSDNLDVAHGIKHIHHHWTFN